MSEIFKADDRKNAPRNMAMWKAYRDLREDSDSLSQNMTMELDAIKVLAQIHLPFDL